MLFRFASKPAPRPRIGLILTGGGARAAYQAGVLAGIARLLPPGAPSPFRIICGTSAGALNAAIIAQEAAHFSRGVERALEAWAALHASSVHRSDAAGVARQVARWAWAALAGHGRGCAVSLLDNGPLRELVPRLVEFSRVRGAIRSGHLDALSVTASSYDSGQSVSFFEGSENLQPWMGARRRGVRATLGPQHLLGSMAMPFMYPPERIGGEYFGDGAIQQLSPISPAIHLGADKVLIIGVGRGTSPPPALGEGPEAGPGAAPDAGSAYPSIGRITGHLFDSIFADTLEADLERIEQINATLALIPSGVRERAGLRQRRVQTWVVRPRHALEELAALRLHCLPGPIRMLLRAAGALRHGSASVMSYLLTEQQYCRSLIRRGFRDAMAQRAEITRFLDLPGLRHRSVARRRIAPASATASTSASALPLQA